MILKKILFFFIITQVLLLYAKEKASIKFYGSHESILNFQYAREYEDEVEEDEDPAHEKFKWGWNNLTNLKIKANIGKYLEFGTSFNINLYTGTYTDTYKLLYTQAALSMLPEQTSNPLTGEVYPTGNLANNSYFSIPFYYKSTYIGAFDLDRLYFEVKHDFFNIEAGLIRIARGFGYIFSPTDFFNPRNPLNPAAKLDGKLAIMSKFYPLDFWRIELFAVAPDNPIEQEGWGAKFGHATNFYLGKINLELLYALFLPEIKYEEDPEDLNLPEYVNNDFTQIAGFSLKADIFIGLFIDAIYRFEHRNFKTGDYYDNDFKGFEGLEAAIGLDYTIKGKVYLLLEYLFYGSGILKWDENKLDRIYENSYDIDWEETRPFARYNIRNQDFPAFTYLRHNYLYGMVRFTANDYLNIGNTYLFGIEDQSSILTFFLEIEPFQAFTINFTATYPFDWKMLDNNRNSGEFGAMHLGFYQDYKISCKMKF